MRNTQAGFTITELVLTMVVFAILLPAVANMISSIDTLNDQGRDLVTIHSLVENKVESLRSASFAGLSNGTTSFAGELPNSIGTPRSASYTVSSASTALKQVDITVSYTNRGETRQVTYRTYVGELGVAQY